MGRLPGGGTRATAVLVLAVALLACGRRTTHRAAPPGVVTVVPFEAASWVRNFNPLLPPGSSLFPSQGGVYEPLMIYNRVTGEYVPWLATSYEWSEGNRRLTFQLRDGVKWSDGRPFSADDVRFTFELMRRHPALDLEGVWKVVAQVEAPTLTQVTFRFQRPYVPGLFVVVERPIVPRHVWESIADPVKHRNQHPVGTGPFTEVQSFKPQAYVLGPNPHYWQPGKPKLRGVRVLAIPSNEQSNLALIQGDIDWIGNFLPAIDRIFVAKDPAHHGYFFPPVEGTTMLYANTRRSPYGDVRVRKALSMALDRERIVRVAMHNQTRAADATALSELYARWRDPGAVAAGDWTRYDPARARALLDEAGCTVGSDGIRRRPDGSRFEVELECVAGWTDHILAAQIMAKNLRQVGVDARVRTRARGAWFDRLQTGEFELSMAYSTGGPTPYSFYYRQMSTETVKPLGERALYNWQRFANPVADQLLARFSATNDEAEQHRLSGALQREFVQHAPAIPLFMDISKGEYNSTRIKGFPSRDDPYSTLAPFSAPSYLLVLTRLEPR